MMNQTWRLSVVIVLLALVAGCGPGGLAITPYQQGYNQGIEEVREARKEGGFFFEVGGAIMVNFNMFPTHEDKSADWNAGYRQGIKDEMAK